VAGANWEPKWPWLFSGEISAVKLRQISGHMVLVLKIAYILNTYPQPSHSFIRRELRALERGGASVLRLSMRRSDMPLVDPADRKEATRTEYVLDSGALGLIAATLAQFARHPARFMRALGLAFTCGRASQRGVLRHLIYLGEAAQVVRRCRQEQVQHLHAHFGTRRWGD